MLHGNSQDVTPTRAYNEEWITLIAYKTTLESMNPYNFIFIYTITKIMHVNTMFFSLIFI